MQTFTNVNYCSVQRVQNPGGFINTQTTLRANNFRLSTFDQFGNAIDGSYYTIRQNVETSVGLLQSSWGLYRNSPTSFVVSADSALPYAVTGKESSVTVVFSLPEALNSGYIRVQAPTGYVWNVNSFKYLVRPLLDWSRLDRMIP
jgi:hypothetical protein